MLTQEQIEEILMESHEKGIPIKNLLKEKSIPDYQYFWCRRKYSKPDVPERFLPARGHNHQQVSLPSVFILGDRNVEKAGSHYQRFDQQRQVQSSGRKGEATVQPAEGAYPGM